MPAIDVPEPGRVPEGYVDPFKTSRGGPLPLDSYASAEARRLAVQFANGGDCTYAPDPRTHRNLRPGKYWACTRPECPPTPLTSWSHLCRACVVHGVAVGFNEQAEAARVVRFSADGGPQRNVRHGDLMAVLAHQLGDEHLAEHCPTGDLARGSRALGLPVPDGIEESE